MDVRILLPLTSGHKWLDILGAIISIGAVLLSSIYLITTFRFFVGSLVDRRYKGKQPLTLPYWIPYLGSALLMTNDAHSFYESAIKKSRGHVVGARLGPLYAYFISGAKNVQVVFRNSRSLTSDFLILEVYKNVIGVPKRDVAIFEADDSGSAAVPYTKVPEDQRIWRHMHEAQNRNLQSTDYVNTLTAVFTREFLRVLDEEPLDEWRSVPIYRFFLNRMGTASSITLLGRGVYKLNPNLTEDFWEFSSGFLSLFMGIPRFLLPKVWDARMRLTDACTKHLKDISDRYDAIQAADLDWDEDLGSRINRSRDKACLDGGISVEGRGSLLAGFMIGINGNAVPIACWIMIELLRTPGLLDAIRDEVATAVSADAKQHEKIDFDIPKLLSLPLLSSVFTETLRLRISTTPTRQLRNDLEVDGYLLKAGNCVMLPSWLAHTEAEWSTERHPANTFQADRFLASKEGAAGEATASSQPKPGTYFPFGGGSSMCPGRFFAKQEVLTAVAMMIVKFDIEFVELVHLDGKKSARGPEADVKGAGTGALSPDRDMTVRIRRRF